MTRRDRFASGRGQDSSRELAWAGSIVPWLLFGLLCVVSPAFGHGTTVGESVLCRIPDQHERGEKVTAGWMSPVGDVKIEVAVPLTLFQLATPTPVTSPTATVASPPTDTAAPQAPPVHPTDTASPAAPSDTGGPQETVPVTPTEMISLGPSLTPVATDTLTASPTSVQEPAEATPPAPTSVPLTPPALATQPAMPIQEVTTTTAGLEPEAEAPTTYTARVPLPTGSLLDRLTRNKPGIWGNKAFYVGLAVVYVVLLMLFFRLLFQLGRQSD